MSCPDPAEISQQDKELAETLKSQSADLASKMVADQLEFVGGRLERFKHPWEIGVSTAKSGQDLVDIIDNATGQKYDYGYDSFGAALTSTGKHLSILSDFVDTAAQLTALNPAAASIAAEMEATSLGLGVIGIGMRHLGAAYQDLNHGRDPSCPPPTTFPNPDFTDPPISPLVIDLDGDGLELTTLAGSTVHFDFAATGYAQRTGWVLPDDGILVLDANSNGKIDNGHELFGNQDTNGFDVLAYYDGRTGGNYYTDNAVDPGAHDGVIDANDPIYSQLRIWLDLNQNGVADSGELMSLADAGISSIDLGYVAAGGDISGNAILQNSTVGLTGSGTRDISDVWFSVDRTNTIAAGEADPDDAPLPDLHGYGVIKSLHLAMADDPGLADDVTDFIQNAETMSTSAMVTAFQELLFKWADVEGAPSRGGYIDGRVMAFLEKAHDADFTQLYGFNADTGNLGPNAGAALTADFAAATRAFRPTSAGGHLLSILRARAGTASPIRSAKSFGSRGCLAASMWPSGPWFRKG